MKKGIALENDYSYFSGDTQKEGRCQDNKVSRIDVLDRYEGCFWGKCSNPQFFSLLKQGPLSVGIDGEGNGIFKEYRENT